MPETKTYKMVMSWEDKTAVRYLCGCLNPNRVTAELAEFAQSVGAPSPDEVGYSLSLAPANRWNTMKLG